MSKESFFSINFAEQLFYKKKFYFFQDLMRYDTRKLSLFFLIGQFAEFNACTFPLRHLKLLPDLLRAYL